MGRRYLALLLLLGTVLVAGCGSEPPENPPEDPALTAFRVRALAFVREGRGLARLLERAPSLADYDAQLAKVQGAFRRIPEPEGDALAPVCAGAKGIMETFEAVQPLVRRLPALLQLAREFPESKAAVRRAEKARAICKSTAQELLAGLAKTESAVKLGGRP